MAKLLADENFPFPVVEKLRELGHDVTTLLELGKASQKYPDDKVLLTASEDNCAVLTSNRKHFKKLHQEVKNHSGIISCTYNPDFENQAQLIHETIEEEEVLEGKLVKVNRPA